MGKMTTLLVFFVLTTPAAADPVPATVTVLDVRGRPVGRGEVRLHRSTGEVRVVHGPRGDPPGAVTPSPVATASVRDGRAVLPLPSAGRWRLVAVAPGHAPAEAEVAWAPGIPAPSVTLVLSAAAVLEGRVLLDDVTPLPEVEVAVVAHVGLREHRTRTGSDGGYRLDELSPGIHDLWSRRPGGLWRHGAVVILPSVRRFDLRLVTGAVIEGRVTAKGSGKGIAGATVELIGDSFSGGRVPLARATCGADGTYTLATGRSWMNSGGLRVSAPGHATRTRMDRGLWNLGSGDRFRRDVALEPGARLRGRVTGPAGAVAGARVSAWFSAGRPFGRLDRVTVRTAADGTYAIDGLPAGQYGVEVEAKGAVHRGWKPPEWPDERTAGEVPSGAWVLLALGQSRTVDVALAAAPRRAGSLTVDGVVRDGDGAPLALAVVDVTGADPVLTGADGRFRVEGRPRPGRAFGVRASKRGYASKETYLAAEKPEARTGLVIVLARSPILRGRVVSSIGRPVGGARVTIAQQGRDKRGGTHVSWRSALSTVVRADGTFETSVPSMASIESAGGGMGGSWEPVFAVGVMADGHAPTVSEPFALERGRAEYRIDLALAAGHRLEGVVRAVATGRPLANAPVKVSPIGFTRWPPIHPPTNGYAVRAVTDDEGRWRLEDLAPGRYSVRAEMTGFVEERSEIVVPAAGAIVTDLLTHHPLAGVVVDGAGKPLAGMRVRTLDAAGKEGRRDATTDEDGRFRFVKLPAGRYTVVADQEDEASTLAPDVVGPVEAGREDIRLTLRPGLVLEGRLLDATGKPLPEVSVSAGPRAGGPPRSYDRTDGEGRFRLVGLRSGPHFVVFRQPGVTVRGVMPGKGLEHRLAGDLTISGRIRRQEFEMLRDVHRPMLEAVPIDIEAPEGVTRSHAARVNRENGTFVFRYLPAGSYRIRGTIRARVRDRRRLMAVRGDVVVKAGTDGVEIRLVFADEE